MAVRSVIVKRSAVPKSSTLARAESALLEAEASFDSHDLENARSKYELAEQLFTKAGAINRIPDVLIEKIWLDHLCGSQGEALEGSDKLITFVDKHCSVKTQLQARLNLLHLLAEVLQYREAEGLSYLILSDAKFSKFKALKGRVHLTTAQTLLEGLRVPEAEVHLMTAYSHAQTCRDFDLMTLSTAMLGVCSAMKGDFARAMEYYERAEKVPPPKTSKEHELHLIFNRRQLYSYARDVGTADYLLSSYDRVKAEHEPDDPRCTAQEEIAEIQLFLVNGWYADALEYFQILEDDPVVHPQFKVLAPCAEGRAYAYVGLGEYASALEWFWKAVDRIQPHYIDRLSLLCRVVEGLSLCYRQLMHTERAMKLDAMTAKLRSLRLRGLDGSYAIPLLLRAEIEALTSFLFDIRDPTSGIYKSKGWEVDLRQRKYTKPDGKSGSLTDGESEAFNLLRSREGHVVFYSEIVHSYYKGEIDEQSARDRAKHMILAIRKKLGPCIKIINEPRAGYKLVPK